MSRMTASTGKKDNNCRHWTGQLENFVPRRQRCNISDTPADASWIFFFSNTSWCYFTAELQYVWHFTDMQIGQFIFAVRLNNIFSVGRSLDSVTFFDSVRIFYFCRLCVWILMELCFVTLWEENLKRSEMDEIFKGITKYMLICQVRQTHFTSIPLLPVPSKRWSDSRNVLKHLHSPAECALNQHQERENCETWDSCQTRLGKASYFPESLQPLI